MWAEHLLGRKISLMRRLRHSTESKADKYVLIMNKIDSMSRKGHQ